MPRPVQKRIPILLAAKANETNALLVAELCDGWESGPDDSKSLDKLKEGVEIYRRSFAAAGRDPGELIVKSHLIPERSAQGEVDWDKLFSNVPAMLELGVTEFACAMPIGMKAPMSLTEIAGFMDQLAGKAQQF